MFFRSQRLPHIFEILKSGRRVLRTMNWTWSTLALESSRERVGAKHFFIWQQIRHKKKNLSTSWDEILYNVGTHKHILSHCCNPPEPMFVNTLLRFALQIAQPSTSSGAWVWVSAQRNVFSDCPFWPQLQLLSLHLSIWLSPPMNLGLAWGFKFDRGSWDSEGRCYLLIGLRFAEQIFIQLK